MSAPAEVSSSAQRGRRGLPAWAGGWLSTVLIVLGAFFLQTGVVAGYINHEVLDADRLAGSVDQLRQEPAVSAALGRELTSEFLKQQPDAVALRPLIDSVATSIIGSSLLSGPTRVAVVQLQRSLTEQNSSAVVLRIADAGSVLAAVLQRVAPAGTINASEAKVSLKLAQVGGQSFAGKTIKLAQFVRTASWLLPLVGTVLMLLGVLLAARRRRAVFIAGTSLLAFTALVALALLAGGWWAASQDTTTVAGALINRGWPILVDPAWWSVLAVGTVGLLLTASAASVLPDFNPVAMFGTTWRLATRRPKRAMWQVIRAVVVLLLGILIAVRPSSFLAVVGVLAGVWVVLYGIHELAAATNDEQSRLRRSHPAAGAPAPGAPPKSTGKRAWGTAAIAAVTALAVLVALVAWGSSSSSASATAGQGTVVAGQAKVCNGYAVLCDRRYNEVAYAASHNSMSTASDPHWFIPEQSPSIIGQLDNGVHALLIDVWHGYPTTSGRVATAQSSFAEAQAQLVKDFGPQVVAAATRVVNSVSDPTPAGPQALYLCHGLCELGWNQFQSQMAAVKSWLDTHPDEVLTLDIEDHVPGNEIGATLTASGLAAYAATVPAAGQQWPTLREMITSGHRLVVMLEAGDGGPSNPWLVNAYQRLLQETPYDNSSLADLATCKPNRGAATAPLFLMNHWLSGFGQLVSNARQANTQAVLGTRAELCRKQRQLPNFVAVNYADIGALQAVVRQLNGVS